MWTNYEKRCRVEVGADAAGRHPQKATERAFTGRYWTIASPEVYRCVCCGTELFRSHEKFDSGTGGPRFTRPAAEENAATESDDSLSWTAPK